MRRTAAVSDLESDAGWADQSALIGNEGNID